MSTGPLDAGSAPINQPLDPEIKRKNVFTDDEKEFLGKWVKQYQEANRKGRKRLLGNEILVPFLNQFYPGIAGNDRKMKKMDVRNFFANNARQLGAAFRIWNKQLRFRDVVLSVMKAEFEEWQQKQGYKSTKGQIGSMQLQLSEYIQTALTEAETERLEKLRQKYEEDVYPMDLQIKHYNKWSSKVNYSVDRACYQRMGQYRLTFIASHKSSEEMQVEMVDNMGDIITFECESIEQKFPAETAAFFKVWQKYTAYIRECELRPAGQIGLQTVEPAPPKKSAPKPHVTLEHTPNGVPLLPEKQAHETGLIARQYVRAYVAKQYERAGGKDAPPYSRMSANMAEFIREGCYPPGFVLKDPSVMTAESAISFCDHIRKRQESVPEEEVFRFLRVRHGRLSSTIVEAKYGDTPESNDSSLPRQASKRKRRTNAKGKSKAKPIPPPNSTPSPIAQPAALPSPDASTPPRNPPRLFLTTPHSHRAPRLEPGMAGPSTLPDNPARQMPYNSRADADYNKLFGSLSSGPDPPATAFGDLISFDDDLLDMSSISAQHNNINMGDTMYSHWGFDNAFQQTTNNHNIHIPQRMSEASHYQHNMSPSTALGLNSFNFGAETPQDVRFIAGQPHQQFGSSISSTTTLENGLWGSSNIPHPKPQNMTMPQHVSITASMTKAAPLVQEGSPPIHSRTLSEAAPQTLFTSPPPIHPQFLSPLTRTSASSQVAAPHNPTANCATETIQQPETPTPLPPRSMSPQAQPPEENSQNLPTSTLPPRFRNDRRKVQPRPITTPSLLSDEQRLETLGMPIRAQKILGKGLFATSSVNGGNNGGNLSPPLSKSPPRAEPQNNTPLKNSAPANEAGTTPISQEMGLAQKAFLKALKDTYRSPIRGGPSELDQPQNSMASEEAIFNRQEAEESLLPSKPISKRRIVDPPDPSVVIAEGKRKRVASSKVQGK